MNSTKASISTTVNNKDAFYTAFMQDIEMLPLDLIKALSLSFYALGAVCNVILFLYIVKRKRYKSPTFAVIFSLCIGDTGTCVAASVMAALVLPTVNGPEWLCSLCIWLMSTFYFSSVLHIIMFSIIRFYQLVFPLKARRIITLGLLTKTCACLWVAAPLSAAVVPAIYKAHTFLYKGQEIVICEVNTDSKIIHLFIDTIYLLFPNIIITIFQLSKHIIVRRQTRNANLTGETQVLSRKTTDARAITVVIVVFCVTSLPQCIHTYAHYIFEIPIRWFHHVANQIGINLLAGNSCLNPIIYVLCSATVRTDIFLILNCKRSE